MFEGLAGSLLREARRRSQLSQIEVAARANVTQSVVSAYECGARQPSLPMLMRLVAATGFDLEVEVGRGQSGLGDLNGPLGRRLRQHRRQVRRTLAAHGLSNIRVFGSVARSQEREDSDIDLLVDVAPGTGLIGLARCQHDLERLLDAHVDLVPADGIKAGVAPAVLAEAVVL